MSKLRSRRKEHTAEKAAHADRVLRSSEEFKHIVKLEDKIKNVDRSMHDHRIHVLPFLMIGIFILLMLGSLYFITQPTGLAVLGNETINISNMTDIAISDVNLTDATINITPIIIGPDNISITEPSLEYLSSVDEVTNTYAGKLKTYTLRGKKAKIGRKDRYQDAEFDPGLRTIRKLKFHNLTIEDGELSLGIEDLDIENFKQSYAIDPTLLNFTDATVTVTALGKTLYKCKEWDFQARSCEGAWTVFKTGLTPGQLYTFTLTPDDPAFGEDDSFYEDWESGSKDTNGWSYNSTGVGGWEIVTSDGPLDTYHAVAENIDGEVALEASISTLGYTNITWSFYWKTGSNRFDVGADHYYAEWYNGTGWTRVLSHESGTSRTYQLASFDLPASASNNAAFKIHFLCNVNSNNELCAVDNINVSGTPADNTPPASITNLSAQSRTNDSIYWNWTSPTDIDFAEAIVYINNVNTINTSLNYYNATGFTNNTQYTIKIHTKDTSGNVNNTDVTNTNYTLQNDVYSVSLTDPSDQTTTPGVNVTYYIDITNDGNKADNYTLQITNYNSSDYALLNQTTILDLDPYETRTVELTVGHSTSGNYTVAVNATSQTIPSVYDEVTIKTIITTNIVYGVDLTYSGDQSTDEYADATYNITVTNTGNAPENMTLAIVSSNSTTTYLNQTTILDLVNSTSTVITLTVGDSTPGQYLATINATVDNDPSKYDLLNITTTVQDTTPPAYVTNLQNRSYSYTWIYWNWTNPADSDFNHTEIWINNIFKGLVYAPLNYYNATGLIENTYYTIQTRTVDDTSNINTTWVNNTARTATDDPYPPTINAITDSPDPLAEGQNITFVVNVTDNVNVSTVKIEINNTNYTMQPAAPPYLGSLENLFTDNFNDADITDWNLTLGPTSGWFTTDTENPYDGNHTIARNTDGETILEQSISTVGYQDIEFRFYWSTDSNNFDAADYYYGEWYNGTDWFQVFNFGSGSSTTYQEAVYFLPESATDNPDFKIRFICNVNQGTEGCNLDDVNISGKPFSDGSPELYNYTYNTTGLPSGLNTYYIHASDNVNNWATNYSNFTIIGDAYYGVNLTDPADDKIDNSTTAYYTITLSNNGSVTDTYTLTTLNYNSADTVLLNQSTIATVPPNATRDFILSVASSTPNNYTVRVTATSQGNNSVNYSVNITTEIETYYPPPAGTLFFDGFESGNFSYGGWYFEGAGTDWYIATGDPYSGIYYSEASATVTETILRKNLSTVGFGYIDLSFYWDTDGLDLGEYLRVEWYDGSSWNQILNTYANPATYQYQFYSLPVSANDESEFAVRFKCSASLASEECKVDNVLITGIDIYTPNVTNIQPQGTYYEFNSNITINATVTDNVNVSQVFANITWPGGFESLELFDADNDSIYSANFTDTSLPAVYNITIYVNDTSSNVNDSETGYFVIPYPIKILNMTIQPDDDEFTPGAQINPLEDSNITVNLTANLTNTSIIDSCIINIYNDTGLIKGPYDGTVSVINNQTQCFAEWQMEYWRFPGDYNVTVFVNRTDSVSDQNYTWYYYNELKAFDVNISTIAFNSTPGLNTNSTTAYPLGVKNTGNSLLNISTNATDFIGQTNPSYLIGVQNITYNESGSGLFTSLTKILTPIPTMQFLQPTITQPLYFRGYAPFGIQAQEYKSNVTFSAD